MKTVNGYLWPSEPPQAQEENNTVPKELYDAATGILQEHGIDTPEPTVVNAPSVDTSPPPFLVAKPGQAQPGEEEE